MRAAHRQDVRRGGLGRSLLLAVVPLVGHAAVHAGTTVQIDVVGVGDLTLDVGDKSLPIPDSVKTVTSVSLVDIRSRRVPLKWLNRKDFREMGLGRTEFRGLPKYYRIDGRAIHFWPAASHRWQIVLTIDDVATQDQIDERENTTQPA